MGRTLLFGAQAPPIGSPQTSTLMRRSVMVTLADPSTPMLASCLAHFGSKRLSSAAST